MPTDQALTNLAIAQRKRWARYRESAAEEARTEFAALSNDPVFIAGIMLYWGEGDNKPGNQFRLSNSNPDIIATFVRFLTITLKIPTSKIRLALILYPDLLDDPCKLFWSNTVGIPLTNFHKTQYIQGRHPTKRLSHGVCMVVVNDKRQKLKYFTWVDIFLKKYIL